MNWQRILRVAAFVAVLAIFVGARFWNLTFSCLWFDEIFSVHAAEHSWDGILNFVALDLIHPPLFYLLLKVWIVIGGESLFWLRTFPVIFSILAIFPFFLICRELGLKYWAAILAFFLIAVNGSLIKYAQEVRMYSMLMCISLFSMWLFARYFNTGKGILALTLVNLLLVYSHYFGWLVVISEIFAILLLQRIKWRPIVVMVLVIAVGFTPWLVAVLFAANSGSGLSQNIGWMQRPGIVSGVQLVLSLVEPFYSMATSVDAMSVYRISIPLLLLSIIALVIFYARSRAINEYERTAAAQLFIFVAVPMVIAFVASWVLSYSVWGTRHLIMVFVPFSLLIALSVTKLTSRTLRISISTIILLFCGYAFVVEASRPKLPPVWCGFEVVAKTIQADEHGPVYVFEDLAAYHLWFYFRNYPDEKFRQRVIKVDDFPGMTEDKSYFIPRGLDDWYLTNENFPLNSGPDYMWIVYRAQDLDLTKPPLDTLTNVGFRVIRQEVYDGGSTKVIALRLEKNGESAGATSASSGHRLSCPRE